nr:type-1 angiotensin II receptor B-like [Biomphalaria glabrata]
MTDSLTLAVTTNWSYVVTTKNSEQIVLYSIRRWIFIILPLFIYVLGIPGNILGVIVFRTQAMRENFLSKFFVCVCTNNIFCLIWGLSRHSVEGFANWNYRLYSLQVCFIHSYLLLVQMSFGNWLLVVISGYRAFFIANPDRYASSPDNSIIYCDAKTLNLFLYFSIHEIQSDSYANTDVGCYSNLLAVVRLTTQPHEIPPGFQLFTIIRKQSSRLNNKAKFNNFLLQIQSDSYANTDVGFYSNLLAVVCHSSGGTLFLQKLYRCEISKGGSTGTLSMSIFAFVPGMLLLVCNTYMYWNHNAQVPHSMATRWTNIKVRNQLFRMVVLSNMLFLATNIPLALFYSAFSVIFDLTSAVNLARAKLGLGISAMLFYIGQSMNVVLYCVYGSIFRRELKRIVRPCCPDFCQEIVAQEEISNASDMSSKQKEDFIAEMDKEIEMSEIDADDDLDETFRDFHSTNEPPESFRSITRFSVSMIGSTYAEPIG